MRIVPGSIPLPQSHQYEPLSSSPLREKIAVEPELETENKSFSKEEAFKLKQNLQKKQLQFEKRKYEEEKLNPEKKPKKFGLATILLMVLIVLGMAALVYFLGLL